ncbi:unnamed protein product [Spirodela intermedia]|uniref:NAB domain-containing protein n=1 Tax=Spirodela intermedia TaxID=51605 RepID=A0A7I8L805_SPIIN|nr:unnamed protein product [Spirodela intermedia]
MKRMVSRKSHSWWWDGHINPKNSKWMVENLEEMDRHVKEMLKLIEEEGDSFAKKAEMFYQRRPELVSHVEDLYRMYRALAERYDHLTGELRKNIPSRLQSLGSAGSSDTGSEPPSPSRSPLEETPDQTFPQAHINSRTGGLNLFLGSGGESDSIKNIRSPTSSSSESGSYSESEDAAQETDAEDRLSQRIAELEAKLLHSEEKLRSSHGPLLFRVSELETELAAANEELQSARETIRQLQQRTSLEIEKNSALEAAHSATVEQLNSVASTRDQTLRALEMEIAVLREQSSQEKARLEAAIAGQEMSMEELRASVEGFTRERSLLESKIRERDQAIEESSASMASLSEALASLRVKLSSSEEEGRKRLEEEAGRAAQGLLERVEVLEREVENQRAMISDGAEKKREAIRQLCFSLEHYRDGYNELRQALLDYRRPPSLLSS